MKNCEFDAKLKEFGMQSSNLRALRQSMPKKERIILNSEEKKLIEEVINLLKNKYNEKEILSMLYNYFPYVPKRQIRTRYIEVIDPQLTRIVWTSDDDKLLVSLVGKYGRNFQSFHKNLPGKTEKSMKNRYNELQKKDERTTSFKKLKKIKNQKSETSSPKSLDKINIDEVFSLLKLDAEIQDLPLI